MRKVEATIQKEMIQFCRASDNLKMAFHVNNEGAKSVGQAVQDKKLGTLAGVPDLCIPMGLGRVVWIEVKTLKGKLSRIQSAMHFNMVRLDQEIYVVKGLAEGMTLLKTLEGNP